MKGLQMLNGWCLLFVAGLLVVQQIDVTAAYTMEETCKYIQSGFIADPSDCQSYGFCNNTELQFKGKCPTGAYYDPGAGVCDYKKACRFNVGTMCQGVNATVLYAHPDNCTEYVICENGVANVGACPKFQIFDSVKNQCVYSGNTECVAESICRLAQDNVFAADPKNCGNFIACQKGTGQSRKCKDELYFSQITNTCQSTQFCVDNNNGNTNSDDQPPEKPAASMCTAAVKYISDGATCYGYFKCTEVGKVGDWLKCPPKTHFNPDDQKCVTPYTFKCEKDRCGNMDAEFMASATSGDCKNYLNCKNNKYFPTYNDPTFIGVKCNKDYYFDEYLQQCVPNSPSSNPHYILCPPPPPKITG